MVDGHGDVVGTVSPPRYLVGIVRDDGNRAWIALPAGDDDAWAVRTRVDRSDIASITIADPEGRIWCQARFA